MKHYNLLALPCLALSLMAASCSKDDDKQPSQTGQEIRFQVVAPATPRMAHVETTTQTINQFLLNAFVNQRPFITNLQVTGGNGNWQYTPAYYWPANTVNFYAVSPMELKSATGVTGDSFKMSYANTGETDMLYSVAAGQQQTSATTPQPVLLNFRHALARVAVLLRSSNTQLSVQVNQVALANIKSTGIFEFPKETTAQNTNIKGSWSEQNAIVSPTIYTPDTKNPGLLTGNPTEFSNKNYNFAMPQDLAQVVPESVIVEGSYIEVRCKISDTKGNALWPNATTPADNKDEQGNGIIRYPLCRDNAPMNWEAGKAYLYNIDIKEAPGLEKISFDVTVDEINYDQNTTDMP